MDAAFGLSELCDAYVDPVSGEKSCQKLARDTQCSVDSSIDVSKAVAQVLQSDFSATLLEALCHGPCWPDISKVYSAILFQWALFDPSLAPVYDALKIQCLVQHQIGTLSVELQEETSIKGLDNTIQISITSDVELPHRSSITIRGINALPVEGALPVLLQDKNTSIFMSLVSWEAPICTQWCPSSGICASSEGCQPMCEAQGYAFDHRCVQWCDRDGVLTIQQDSEKSLSAGQMATVRIVMTNPSVQQVQRGISVTVCAPGVSIDVNQTVSGPILTGATDASFSSFSLKHLECKCSSLQTKDSYYDEKAAFWRGGCPGMLNTMTVELQTSVPLLPGSQLTLTGLTSVYGQGLEAPVVNVGQGVSIVQWDEIQGELSLHVLPGAHFEAQQPIIFSLDIQMPKEPKEVETGTVSASIRASKAGKGSNLCVKEHRTSFLAATSPSCTRSFVVRTLDQTTCEPSTCNDVTMRIAVNKAFTEEFHHGRISIAGFPAGVNFMECLNSSSLPCDGIANNSVPLSDGVPGSNHRNLFQDLSGTTGRATWDKPTNRLLMILANGAKLLPFHEYTLVYKLKNAPSPSVYPIRIAASGANGCENLFTNGNCIGEEMNFTQFGVCNPTFVTARVSQENSLPGCNGQRNTLTFTLTTNVELKTPWQMNFTGLYVSDVRYVSGLGELSNVDINEKTPGIFTIAVASFRFLARTTYVIVFSVLNTGDPVTFQRQNPRVTARAVGIFFEKLLYSETNMNVDGVQIQTPTIHQSNPYPSAVNSIEFALKANVALPPGAKITISGLTNTTTIDGKLTIGVPRCYSGNSTSMLSKTGNWNQSTGKLVLTLESHVGAQTLMSASFNITNPGVANTPPSIITFTISCNNSTCFDNHCFFPLEMSIDPVVAIATLDRDGCLSSSCQCACLKCKKGCTDCGQACGPPDAVVLRVHAPGIILKHISQSSNWPMANSTIRIRLAFNIWVRAPTTLTLTGFGGLNKEDIALVDKASVCKSILWDMEAKAFELQVGEDGMLPGITYQFELGWVNADCSQRPPVLMLSSSDISRCDLGSKARCILDGSSSYFVAHAGFLKASIVQSTTLPSAANTVKVTLSFNVPRSKGSRITLSGLTQSATTDISSLVISTSNLTLVQTGSWKQQSGTLTVTLDKDLEAGRELYFSFDLENPRTELGGLAITASALCDSCNNGVKSILMASPSVEGMEQGTQIPLTVKSYHLTKHEIGQSSALPKVENSICVTLAVSSTIFPEPQAGIKLSGFSGAQAPEGLMVIKQKGDNLLLIRSNSKGIPNGGVWNNTEKSLNFVVVDGMKGSSDYVLCFTIVNPSFEQEAVAITLEMQFSTLTPEQCARQAPERFYSIATKVLDCDQRAPTGILFALEGDACPMKVYAPMFLCKTITECSAIPNHVNKLSVQLSATVTFTAGSTITIAGLIGSQSRAEAVKVDSAVLFFEQTSWQPSSGVLVITIAEGQSVQAREIITLTVSLQNPLSQQNPVYPTIRAEIPNVGRIAPSAMSGAVFGAAGVPSFTVSSITESSSVRGSYNVLSIVFEWNVAVKAGSKVELKGLKGTASDQTELFGAHVHDFERNFTWVKEEGRLLVTVANDVPQHTKRMFAFYVINSVTLQQAAGVLVSLESDTQADSGLHILNTAMHGRVLTAESAPVFVVKRVGQSSPLPSLRNRITVTLGFNVNYRNVGGSATAQVATISGLQNAKATVGPLHLLGSHPFSRACWQCECPKSDVSCEESYSKVDNSNPFFTFHLSDDIVSGQSYVFSFEITNPSQSQPAQSLSISTPWVGGILQGDGVSVPKRILRAVAGDKLPLYVRALTFSTSVIGQNNSYPCATNTLCVTISLSIPVQEYQDFQMTLSGFLNANNPNEDAVAVKLMSSSGGQISEFQSVNGAKSSGTWSSAQRSVTVQAACRLEADKLYSFCFQLSNPALPQSPPDMYLESNSSQPPKILMSKSYSPVPTIFPFLGYVPDSQALYVRNSKVLSFEMASNSSQICHPNKLTFAFALNIPLVSSCTIENVTIAGLLGLSNPSGNISLLHESLSAVAFGSLALWNANTATITLSLGNGRTLEAGSIVRLSVVMRNGQTAQGPVPNITLSAKNSSTTVATWDEMLLSPLTILPSATLTASIEQSTAWPHSPNTLQASFSVTDDVGGYSPIVLNIFNLQQVQVHVLAQVSVGNLKGTRQIGNPSDGIACDSHPETVFILHSIEDVRERTQEEVADWNADHFLCVVHSDAVWKYFNGANWTNLTKISPSDILIAEVNYESKLVSLISYQPQSPVHRGIARGFVLDRSDLGFTFVDVVRVVGHFFQPSIFIYGFTRTIGDATSEIEIPPSSVTPKSNAVQIELPAGHILRKDARYMFWFLVANPPNEQSAPTISLNVTTDCISLTSKMTSKSSALRIVAPAFLAYQATQTSPFPCSTNTITISFMTNVYIRHENGACLHIRWTPTHPDWRLCIPFFCQPLPLLISCSLALTHFFSLSLPPCPSSTVSFTVALAVQLLAQKCCNLWTPLTMLVMTTKNFPRKASGTMAHLQP